MSPWMMQQGWVHEMQGMKGGRLRSSGGKHKKLETEYSDNLD